MKAVRIFNKELENVKKNQSELKNTVTEKKNILEGIDSRLDDIEEHISDLEDKIMESAQWKQQKGKQILETEDSIRDLWDIKHANIHIMGRVSEGEGREKG